MSRDGSEGPTKETSNQYALFISAYTFLSGPFEISLVFFFGFAAWVIRFLFCAT